MGENLLSRLESSVDPGLSYLLAMFQITECLAWKTSHVSRQFHVTESKETVKVKKRFPRKQSLKWRLASSMFLVSTHADRGRGLGSRHWVRMQTQESPCHQEPWSWDDLSELLQWNQGIMVFYPCVGWSLDIGWAWKEHDLEQEHFLLKGDVGWGCPETGRIRFLFPKGELGGASLHLPNLPSGGYQGY